MKIPFLPPGGGGGGDERGSPNRFLLEVIAFEGEEVQEEKQKF